MRCECLVAANSVDVSPANGNGLSEEEKTAFKETTTKSAMTRVLHMLKGHVLKVSHLAQFQYCCKARGLNGLQQFPEFMWMETT